VHRLVPRLHLLESPFLLIPIVFILILLTLSPSFAAMVS
jgi:hypothetical protein